MLCHVLKHVAAVAIYAIHVLECVLEFVQYHVRQDVQHQLMHVDIGVTQHAIENALVIVIYIASIIVVDHAYHI